MSILLSEGSLECYSLRQARSFTPGRLAVGQSLSGIKRLLPHLTSPHPTDQQEEEVGRERETEREEQGEVQA